MISEPYPEKIYPSEVFDSDSLTSNYGWIFNFTLKERPCKQVIGIKVNQYELEINEIVSDKKFDKLIFQVGAKTNDDMLAVVQTVFYSLITILSYDLDDYSLDEFIHLGGIRHLIDKILTSSKQEPYADGFVYFSKTIIYKQPQLKFHDIQL